MKRIGTRTEAGRRPVVVLVADGGRGERAVLDLRVYGRWTGMETGEVGPTPVADRNSNDT